MITELWLADLDLLVPDGRPEGLLSLLPAPERERALRYRRREDRLRFAAGRLMIHALAAEKLGRADAPLLVSAAGKPSFALADAPQFGLSHSGRLVVLAFGELPLGVDVEERLPLDWRALSSVFPAEEQALLEASGDPLGLFYRLWTLREAFSKEEGLGLAIFGEGAVSLDESGGVIRWQGRTLRCHTRELADYTLSVCAASLGERRLRRLSAGDWRNILALSGPAPLPETE